MTITIRLDGYPLYAFVPEWMVVVYLISGIVVWYILDNYGTVEINDGTL